jgi:hypothetical protein
MSLSKNAQGTIDALSMALATVCPVPLSSSTVVSSPSRTFALYALALVLLVLALGERGVKLLRLGQWFQYWR